MKKTVRLSAVLLGCALLLCGCDRDVIQSGASMSGEGTNDISTELGGFDDAFGGEFSDAEIYEGFFEEDSSDITVECISGTPDCYTLENGTLTFRAVNEDSVYSVSGRLRGNIVIDTGDDFKFDLELHGVSVVSDSENPILIQSGNEVSVTAKKDFQNYLYDMREAVDPEDETVHAGAIHSEVDLEICGKGSLTVVSENNNGIHTKDDLQVKNLTLLVLCADNALKGNDSVEIKGGNTTLIATAGDGIKTSNSNVSEKGNQRGTVTVAGGTHTIYAACDGIDAAYDAVIEEETTELKICTDKYSSYSEEVTAVDEDVYYIRFSSDDYRYSVKYYNSDTDYVWVNASYHSSVSGGRSRYYYYSFPKMDYGKMQFFIYSADMQQGQEDEYLVASEYLTPSTAYDTFALSSRGNSLSYSWTNYTTAVQDGPGGFGGPGGPGGHGGMGEGNTDKGDHSTKGIKAANEIVIRAGNVTVKAYDDAIHAGTDTALENGETPAGTVTVVGGSVTVYSNDDGIHADGALTVTDGTVVVTNSYEGLEGACVTVSGGEISVLSSDDGINGTGTSGAVITVSGGTLYIYAGGDGIDSNSRTSYEGIVFAGGDTVVISTSGGNSAIDTEQGYRYSGGRVLALMPSGGMTSEATHCKEFASVGTSANVSLSAGDCLAVELDGKTVVTVKISARISGRAIYLGSNDASIGNESTGGESPDRNGVCWG